MGPDFPPPRALIETAETLAIALAGGITFTFLVLPAGLVSGSVLSVAAAALLGRPVRLPLRLPGRYVIVGTLLGTVVTPDTLHGVTTWPASIALLMLASLAMIVATMAYLRIVHGWDLFSALFGASPGAMAQVIALSTELGGDLRAIAIVQTVRVLLLVLGLPNGLALFGLVVPALPVPRGPAEFSVLGEMIVLVIVSTAFALAFLRLRFPGGLLFGAMAGSGLLHGAGLDPRRVAVVDRLELGDRARRAGRLALRQYVCACWSAISAPRSARLRSSMAVAAFFIGSWCICSVFRSPMSSSLWLPARRTP